MDSTESDELSDIVMDHMSETRSVMSLVSQSQGKINSSYPLKVVMTICSFETIGN